MWVHQKGKTVLYVDEARYDGVAVACKPFAPHCRQITTPAPHHPIFTGRVLFLTPNQCSEGKKKQF